MEKIAEQNKIIKNYAAQIEALEIENYSLQQENKSLQQENKLLQTLPDELPAKDPLDNALDLFDQEMLTDVVSEISQPDTEMYDENEETSEEMMKRYRILHKELQQLIDYNDCCGGFVFY